VAEALRQERAPSRSCTPQQRALASRDPASPRVGWHPGSPQQRTLASRRLLAVVEVGAVIPQLAVVQLLAVAEARRDGRPRMLVELPTRGCARVGREVP
jgi:hypothetical protein